MRTPLFCLLCLVACGRSELIEAFTPDASTTPPPVMMTTPPPPTKVFGGPMCPMSTTVDALKPGADERVFAVEFLPQEECSSAGGDWFIGRELDGPREVAFGGHTCWFMPDEWREDRQTRRFGVVRVNLRPVTRRVPEGWCLTTLAGTTPVKSDVNVEAFGLYDSAADARLAADALR